MKPYKSTNRFFIAAVILSAVFLLNCADAPRDNDADRWGDNYNDIYADKKISAFSFVNPDVSGIINEEDSAIIVYVTYGTDVTALAAEFTTNADTVSIYGREQRSGITVNDFSEPLIYTVTARDGGEREYFVSAEPVAFASFSITDPLWDKTVAGTIDYDNNTVSVEISYYMVLDGLVANFEAAGEVSVNGIIQESGVTELEFIIPDSSAAELDPLVYNITEENGIIQEYTVYVSFKEVEVNHFAGSQGGAGSADGAGKEASFHHPAGITSDMFNLYVTDTTTHIIRKIEISTGTVTTIAGSAGSAGSADGWCENARFENPKGITTDGANLYVADTQNHTIRRIKLSAGGVSTIAGEADVAGDSDDDDGYSDENIESRFSYPRGVLYYNGILYVADSGNNKIKTIDLETGIVTTIAGTGTPGSGVGDPGTNATFDNPYDLTTDGTNLHVMDKGSNTVRQIVIGGNYPVTNLITLSFNSEGIIYSNAKLYITATSRHAIYVINDLGAPAESLLAGTLDTTGITDGTVETALFDSPSGITVNGSNLYVADFENNTIRAISLSGVNKFVTTLAGWASEAGSVDDTGLKARFHFPQGMAKNNVARLFVADTFNHTIRRVSLFTAEVITVAGSPGESGAVDGAPETARFNCPSGVTWVEGDTDDYLYVADTGNHCIRRVDSDFNVYTIAGDIATHTADNIDGTGTEARFSAPFGIASEGVNIYVADTVNHSIRQITSTGVVTTIAGTGTAGDVDSSAGTPQFNIPSGIVYIDGCLFIADLGNKKIRRIILSTGYVDTFAGTGDTGSSDDLTGVSDGITSRFKQPCGISTDGVNLYVVDLANNLIRRIVISTGAVMTIAGSPSIDGSVDGPGLSATFNMPSAIAFGQNAFNARILYVADSGNNCIRIITEEYTE